MTDPPPDVLTNAPADTLLGQLERGLGGGYLAALAAPRAEAQALLRQCLIVDPRWDHQCEDRAEYYAELACAVELPLEPLVASLHQPAHPGRYWGHGLILDNLLLMLRRGRADAGELLREYVAYGSDPCRVLYGLHQHAQELLIGLDEVLLGRLDELTEDLPAIPEWSWRHPRLAERMSAEEAWHASGRARDAAVASLAELPVAELLALLDDDNRHNVRDAVRQRVVAADAAALLAALDAAQPKRTTVALAGLERIADESHLDALLELADKLPDELHYVWSAWYRCLRAIDSPRLLELGRSWFRHPRWKLACAADDFLARYATPEDLPRILELLATPLDQEEPCGVYQVCAGAEIAQCLPDIGLLPELQAAYHALPYAFGRSFVVKAMAINAPVEFAERHAGECLWDCQWGTRMTAISLAPRVRPWRPRLRAMGADALRDDEERRAARRRCR